MVSTDLGSQASQLLYGFKMATAVLKQIYDITIYGQQHIEEQILQILEKFDGNTRDRLTKKELQRAVDEVNAVSRDSKSFENTLKYK